MMSGFHRKKLFLVISSILVTPVLAAQPETTNTTDSQEQTNNEKTEVIVVHGERENRDGYRPKTVDLGPLGTRSLKDTPYAISVFNRELMDSVGATSLNDVLKYMPSTQMEARGGTDVGRPQSRGMEGSVVDNNHLDGLNVVATTAQPMELYERVEVIQGLTGALYGPASPAGNFNYVFKRPTKDNYNAVTAGLTGDGAWLLHADTGGSPNQYIGYRANVLQEEGDGYVSGSHLNRKLAGLALDINPGENTTVQLNGSYYKFEKFGYPGGFSYSSSVDLPSPMDPTTQGYGQSFSGSTLETSTGSGKIIHQLNGNWKLSAGALFQEAKRTLSSVSNTLNGDGTFTSRMSTSGAAGKFTVTSNMANLTGKVNTGSISHDLVLGTTGYSWKIYSATSRVSSTLGSSLLEYPQLYDSPELNLNIPTYKSGNTSVQSGIIGDTVTWSDYLSTMVIASYSDFDVSNYNSGGSETSSYSKGGASSTISMIYKPATYVSTYLTYADSLESGGTASSTAENAGTTLEPIRSYQTELGVKANIGEFDINAAVFHLKRPMAYVGSDGYYRQQGMQRNNGAEFSINGYLTSALKVYSGVTYLDAVLEDSYDVSTSGKEVVGVPKWQGNILAEYALDKMPMLSLTGNIHYTGKRAANSINSTWAGSYTTVDLGAKYILHKFIGEETTLRLNITNLFDRQYWAAIFPGNIYGSPSASNTAFLGEPRQLRLTATVKF